MLKGFIDIIFTTDFFASTLRLAAPLLLAAMGGIVSERSGVLNMGLDGMMLMGAFFAFAGVYFTGNVWVGLLCAMLSGLFLGIIHAFSCVSLGLNQVVTAVAINIFSLGITSSLLRTFFGTTTNALRSAGFTPWEIPILSKIPILGPIFFKQTVLVYIAMILVPITHYVFFHTTWGLKIRAVGEHPRAADTMGVKVLTVRWLAVLYSSAMGGLAGAALSITGLNTFIDNMSAGRGFIAFACIILGKFSPWGVAIAAVFFGLADSLQLRIQAIGLPIPYQFPIMFPYILTLVVLFVSGVSISPKAWGSPYLQDEE